MMKSMTNAQIRESVKVQDDDWQEICGQLFVTAEERTFDFLGAPEVTEDGHVVFHNTLLFCLWRSHMLGMVTQVAIHHYLDVAFQEDTSNRDEEIRAKKGSFATRPFRLKADAQCPFHSTQEMPVA